MPKITYQPLDRLDPMFDEAPTRYSPRVMGEADQNNRQRNHPPHDFAGTRSDLAKDEEAVDGSAPSRSST
jgi:hypothetical protein